MTQCPLCSSTETIHSVAINDAFKMHNNISYCIKCELYFFSQMMSSLDLEKFYSKEYFTQFEESRLRYWAKSWFSNLRAVSQAKYILNNLNGRVDGGHILECGSADGTLLYQFKKLDWTVRGLEYSESMRSRAKKRFDIDLTPMSVMNLNPDDGLFDVIAFPHVLEHMIDPVAVLSHCSTLLKPHGIIFIEFPFSPYPTEVTKSILVDYLNSTHLYNFRIPSTKQLIYGLKLKIRTIQR